MRNSGQGCKAFAAFVLEDKMELARKQDAGAEIQAGLCLLVHLHPLEKEVSFLFVQVSHGLGIALPEWIWSTLTKECICKNAHAFEQDPKGDAELMKN